MASSTVTLQNVVDFVRVGGGLLPSTRTGGYGNAPLLTLATDVMADILSQRFNWKFNSFKAPSFCTNSWQQDYPNPTLTNLGWLEHCTAVDVNNTALPKPSYWPECVRDLDPNNWQASPPRQVSWEYNNNLVYGLWPGPAQLYTPPLGAVQLPTNGPTAFVDKSGNILLLTTYGVTGPAQPYAVVNATPGTQVPDGTCVWTVCDPTAQGFRLSELPPQQGVVYQLHIVGQLSPPKFTSMDQLLTPLPDDYARFFRRGFLVWCYSIAEDPKLRESFEAKRGDWLAELAATTRQGDREDEAKGFYPDRGITGGGYFGPVGPGDPYERW